jgi:ABC-2 type transport system ATP-binding protein
VGDANAHLTTSTGRAPARAPPGQRLKRTPGVDMIAPFGAALHVSGRDAAMLERAIAPLREAGPQTWRRDEPTLEDVFIDLMGRATDNFG